MINSIKGDSKNYYRVVRNPCLSSYIRFDEQNFHMKIDQGYCHSNSIFIPKTQNDELLLENPFPGLLWKKQWRSWFWCFVW